MSKKNQIIAFGVLVLVALGLAFFPGKKMDTQKNQDSKDVKTTIVEQGKLPDKFPSDFPLEENSKILSNYNFEQGNEIQATRRFVSQKTLAENYSLYSAYLKNNGWNIISNIDQKESKSLSALKGTQSVTVTIGFNAEKQVVVDISFVGAK